MKLFALLRRQRPDHACRTPGCPGRGDADHLMCPDHRPSVSREESRRWLVNPAHNSRATDAHHMPRGGWAGDWQGRRP